MGTYIIGIGVWSARKICIQHNQKETGLVISCCQSFAEKKNWKIIHEVAIFKTKYTPGWSPWVNQRWSVLYQSTSKIAIMISPDCVWISGVQNLKSQRWLALIHSWFSLKQLCLLKRKSDNWNVIAYSNHDDTTWDGNKNWISVSKNRIVGAFRKKIISETAKDFSKLSYKSLRVY